MRVGIDAQSTTEIREAVTAHGDRYRRRVYTAQEIAACGGWGVDSEAAISSLAARFAAKEAVLKVLRELPEVPAWTQIEVVIAEGGRPSLRLHGVAAELADRAGLSGFELSLSHTADMAVAVVIANSPT